MFRDKNLLKFKAREFLSQEASVKILRLSGLFRAFQIHSPYLSVIIDGSFFFI